MTMESYIKMCSQCPLLGHVALRGKNVAVQQQASRGQYRYATMSFAALIWQTLMFGVRNRRCVSQPNVSTHRHR